jgi:DNA-binding GntR family transcriptional regulator
MLDIHGPISTIEFDKLVPLRRQVADWLFRRILCGDLRPGSRLALNQIANGLGISATPVREAMLALESLGLLAFRHNCGAKVKPFGVKEISGLYQVWNVLNQAMYRSARRQIDLHSIEQLHDDMLALQAEPDSDSWMGDEPVLTLERRKHESEY